jgi:hypothetical protein
MVACFVMLGVLPFLERVKLGLRIPANGDRFSGSGSKRLFGQYCRYHHRGCNVSVNDAEGDMMRRSFVNTQHGSETQHSAAGILDSVPSSLPRAIRR